MSKSDFDYFRSEHQTGLPIALAQFYQPTAEQALTLAGGEGSIRITLKLSYHQLNILIHELEVARDAITDYMEAEHQARCAPLAEPDDAAPGHELLEPHRGTIEDAFVVNYELGTRYLDTLLVKMHSGKARWLHVENSHAPEATDIAVGDTIDYEIVGDDFGRVVSVDRSTRAANTQPIDWLQLFMRRLDAEQADENYQERERDHWESQQGRAA